MTDRPATPLYGLRLRDDRGGVTAHLVAEARPLPADTSTPRPRPVDLVFVLDMSGSMTPVVAEVRTIVEHLVVAEELRNEAVRVSIVDYAGAGDARVLVRNASPAEILANPDRIRALRPRGLTCASQVFPLVDALREEGRSQVVALHSDGWFNDASPARERAAAEQWARTIRARDVTLHTVAHGAADFAFLDRMAREAGGQCHVAPTLRDLHDALHRIRAMALRGLVALAPLSLEGADFLTAHDLSTRRVNGSTRDLVLRVPTRASIEVTRFRRVSASRWDDLGVTPTNAGSPHARPFYAAARAALAEGRLNEAKRIVQALGDLDLWDAHRTALTSARLARFASDLDDRLGGSIPLRVGDPSDARDARTVLGVLDLLLEHVDHIALDLTATLEGWKRQGEQDLPGAWEGETFVPCPVSLVPVDDPSAARITALIRPAERATLTIQTTREARLAVRGAIQSRVGGRPYAPRVHRSYSVLTDDGGVGLPNLVFRTSSALLFRALQVERWLPEGATYYADEPIRLDLRDVPAVAIDPDLPFPSVDDAQQRVVLTIALKCVSALVRAAEGEILPSRPVDDDGLTPAQREALAALHITPRWNFSPPMAKPWPSPEARVAAIADGQIDARVGYRVLVGTRTVVSPSEIPSGNEILGRYVSDRRDPSIGVTFADLRADPSRLEDLAQREILPRYAKPWDPLMIEILHGFFGRRALPPIGSSARCWITAPAADLRALEARIQADLDAIQARIAPVVLALGATGFVPEGWSATTQGPIDGKTLLDRFPKVHGPKKVFDEGTFWTDASHRVSVGIVPETVWYTTPKGEARNTAILRAGDRQ